GRDRVSKRDRLREMERVRVTERWSENRRWRWREREMKRGGGIAGIKERERQLWIVSAEADVLCCGGASCAKGEAGVLFLASAALCHHQLIKCIQLPQLATHITPLNSHTHTQNATQTNT